MANTAEERVLIAALERDAEEVKRRLKRFLPTELVALEVACVLIERVINSLTDDEIARPQYQDRNEEE